MGGDRTNVNRWLTLHRSVAGRRNERVGRVRTSSASHEGMAARAAGPPSGHPLQRPSCAAIRSSSCLSSGSLSGSRCRIRLRDAQEVVPSVQAACTQPVTGQSLGRIPSHRMTNLCGCRTHRCFAAGTSLAKPFTAPGGRDRTGGWPAGETGEPLLGAAADRWDRSLWSGTGRDAKDERIHDALSTQIPGLECHSPNLAEVGSVRGPYRPPG